MCQFSLIHIPKIIPFEELILGMGRDIPINTHTKNPTASNNMLFHLGAGSTDSTEENIAFFAFRSIAEIPPVSILPPREIISIQRKENINTEVRGYLQKHPVNSGRAGLDPRHFSELWAPADSPQPTLLLPGLLTTDWY